MSITLTSHIVNFVMGVCSDTVSDKLNAFLTSLQERLKAGDLPPNHDLERAARLSHLRASRAILKLCEIQAGKGTFQFDVRSDLSGFIDAADKYLATQQKTARASDNLEQDVPTAGALAATKPAVDAAFAQFAAKNDQHPTSAQLTELALEEIETAINLTCPAELKPLFFDAKKGWAEAYRYCLGEEFKTKERFQRIYQAFKLSDIEQKLDDISDNLCHEMQSGIDSELKDAINQILQVLVAIDDRTIDIEKGVEFAGEAAYAAFDEVGALKRSIDALTVKVSGAFQKMSPTDDVPAPNYTLYSGVTSESAAQSPAISASDNPYLGLAAFHEEHADRFFGREAITTNIGNNFCSLIEASVAFDTTEPRFLALHGPSGSGKSSLARAGIIPYITQHIPASISNLEVLNVTPTQKPLRALAKILLFAATGKKPTIESIQKYETILLKTTDGHYTGFSDIVESIAQADGHHLLILVDQFEEIFSLGRNAQNQAKEEKTASELARTAFIENLLFAASKSDGKASVLITIRSDFLQETQRYEVLNKQIAEHGRMVPAMTEAELELAITQPAKQAGVMLEPGFVGELISQTKSRAGALPLLQFALQQVWEGIQQGDNPSAKLDELGGVGGALANVAAALYASLRTDAEKETVKCAFVGMVQFGDSSQNTRRKVSLSSLIPAGQSAGHVKAILKKLSGGDCRLITLSSSDDDLQVEITHEALIANWPELQNWLDQGQEDERFHRKLQDAARRHQTKEGSLWSRSPEIDDLRAHYETSKGRFTDAEMSFYQQSSRSASLGKFARVGAVLGLVIAFVTTLGLYKNQLTLAEKNFELIQSNTEDLGDYALAEATQGNLAKASRLIYKAASQSKYKEDSASFAKLANGKLSAILTQARMRHQYIALRGHTGRVSHAAFSSDGSRIITASWDGTARLWNADGTAIRTLKGHTNGLDHAAFSSDGSRIITASWDETARLWDTDGTLIRTLKGHEGNANYAAFNPEGSRIITKSLAGTVRLWDADGTLITALKGHTDSVNHTTFSPDGTRIVTASSDQTARVWDVDGTLIRILKGHTNGVKYAVFNRDGSHIITASADRTARLWSADGTLITVLRGHKDRLNYAAFSNDGSRILTASADNTARLWNTDGTPIRILGGHTGRVIHAAFSSNGSHIITVSRDGSALLWDGDGTLINTLEGHTDKVLHAAFNPKGSLIITTSLDNTARLWNVEGSLIRTLKGHTDQLYHAAFNGDGGRIVTAAKDKTARLWDADGTLVRTFEGHTGSVYHAAFSSDGSHIVTASHDGSARIWDGDGALINTLKGHTDKVLHAAFNPEGSLIITTSSDSTARLWNVEGTLINTFEGHTGMVIHATFSSDGSRILTASADKAARLWQADGTLIAELKGHTGMVVHAVFSTDGSRIVTASLDKTARLWDATGTLISTLRGHTGRVIHAVFSTDGSRILTASLDKTARLWDATGTLISTLRGHTAGVMHAAFNPNGSRIITASSDKTARLWDANGDPINIFKGHAGHIIHAAFSSDGSRIITASGRGIIGEADDNTARLWNSFSTTDELTLKQHACRLLGQPDPALDLWDCKEVLAQ